VEVHWQRKDGERIIVRLSGRPVERPAGELAYFEVFAEDITERRFLERQLQQSQKMDAIGRLAGGVAHDFISLLGVILGQTELLQDELGNSPSVHRRAEAIDHAARRAAELTKQLLAFSRQQFIEPRIVDTNAVVRDIEKLLKRLIGEDVELTIHLQPNAGNIKVDPSQLEQILMNLAVNARDAMPDGGKLILETAYVELDEAYARQHLGAKAGDFVMLVVSDTGTGMDSQTMARIFEPFFTTKTEGRGTGLGLSTVYGVVKQNNGYIMPYSEVGHGTTFRVYFPRVRETPDLRDKKSSQEEFAKGCETILIVEDEEALRELARASRGQRLQGDRSRTRRKSDPVGRTLPDVDRSSPHRCRDARHRRKATGKAAPRAPARAACALHVWLTLVQIRIWDFEAKKRLSI